MLLLLLQMKLFFWSYWKPKAPAVPCTWFNVKLWPLNKFFWQTLLWFSSSPLFKHLDGWTTCWRLTGHVSPGQHQTSTNTALVELGSWRCPTSQGAWSMEWLTRSETSFSLLRLHPKNQEAQTEFRKLTKQPQSIDILNYILIWTSCRTAWL